MSERLYRSLDDRFVAGVAGGMAQAWDVDPSLIRVLWTVLVFMTGGLALLVYVVMAIVVPEEHQRPHEDADAALSAQARGRGERRNRAAALVFGGLLIVVGISLLAEEFVPSARLDRLWQLVVIGLGLLLAATALSGRSRAAMPEGE